MSDLVSISAGRRFALVALTWLLIGLAQPGVLRPDGFGHLAFFAVAPWAWAACRPGRKAFLAEWGAHTLGLAGVFYWMVAFMPGLLVPMSLVPALYPALVGLLLRRAPATWPLALLAPAAWMLAEVVRWSLPVPASFGWFRLGMLMHDTEWIVGSAAVFGTWGLTWGLAALGGWAADVARALTRPEGTRSGLILATLFGLGPLSGLVFLDQTIGAPDTEPGPDVLIVQPGIEQEIKAAGVDPFHDMYVPQVTRTLQGIYETQAPGAVGDDAYPDLILWGETFLPGKLAPPAVFEAFDKGARTAAWARKEPLNRMELRFYDRLARDLAAALFGKSRMKASDPRLWRSTFGAENGPEWGDRVGLFEPLIPPGTSFLTGVEAWTLLDVDDSGAQELRSMNGVALWSADGTMSEIASKVHVVPGGESSDPLRGIPFVIEAIRKVARNVPDFVGADRPTVLNLQTRSDGNFQFGVLICFDNAFDDVFATPFADDGVDFFVIASNEAWYEDSPLMDHMLAFSRIAAAATHRAVVRATNSGISCVVGPDGRVTAMLTEEGPEGLSSQTLGGARKMVSGVLRARIPVLDRSGTWAGATTPFVQSEPWQGFAWGGLGALILLLAALVGARSGGERGGPAEDAQISPANP